MAEESAETKSPKLKKLNLFSRGSNAAGLRGVKVVKPACQVPVAVQGKTEYTTGPCQQAVKSNPMLAFSWFKTCTHGPQMESDGTPIPPELRCYYDLNVVIERTPIVEEGIIKEWRETPRYDVQLRITQATVAEVAMSGQGLRYALDRGAKFPKEFGIADFCEYKDCYRQDVKKFRNGTFCSAIHAKLVKARETGIALALGGFDSNWPNAVSSEKRALQLKQIDV